MNPSAVTKEIADRLRGAQTLAGRTYEWPIASISSAPAAIVTVPARIDYDQTYARGRDRWDGVAAVAVGKPNDRATWDALTRYLGDGGPENLKALVEADGYASCDSVTMSTVDTDVWQFGSIDYLTIVCSLEIWGPGRGA